MKTIGKLVFNLAFIFCVSFLTVSAIAGTVDSVVIDDPIVTDGIGELDFSGNFFADNWGLLLSVMAVLLTLIARIVPSAKQWDWLPLVVQIIDAIVPNRAKMSNGKRGKFKYRKKED